MRRLIDFLPKIRIFPILTVLFAGVLLITTTACNPGDQLGARPNNPPVQLGGENNPHKMGGDGYTEYKMSTDPKVSHGGAKSQKQALLPYESGQLIAAGYYEAPNTNYRLEEQQQSHGILYPGSDAQGAPNSQANRVGPRGTQVFAKDATEIPKHRQPVLDRSNPDNKILERVGEEFKESSAFLKDTAEGSLEHPEMQINPARDR